MQLNDESNDEERQHLLPFVTRLACADTPQVEREREAYITARLRWRQPFCERLAILKGALAVRRQPDELARGDVRAGMEGVEQRVSTSTSVDEHPLFAKVHGSFAGIF